MPPASSLRLVPVAAATWAAAACAIWMPSGAAWGALALWLVVAAATACVLRSGRRTGRVALMLVVLAAAGAAASVSHVALVQPERARVEALALDGGRAVTVEAEVTGKVEIRADGSLAFDARTRGISRGSGETAVAVDVVVRVAPDDVDDPTALDVGAIVRASGTAQPGRSGERAVLVVWASRGVDVTRAPAGVAAATAALRRGLVAAVAGLPGEGAGLVPGLAVGDTSAVSPALDAAMKASSLSHLTAVSGANCALVVGIAFALVALAGAPRRLRVAAGLSALAGFVLLVTPEPSVVRAAAMAAIAMLGVLLGRTGAGLALLCTAITLLMMIDPWLAGSLGFALSVAATASLLVFARPLASGLSRAMPRALALALAVPLAAQLACGPLLVLIAPTVPVYGVVANLIAGPAAPVATVIGLIACLAAPLPWLQSGLTVLAWLPASWIAGTASTMAALPAGQLPWLEGVAGAVTLAVVGAAVAAAIVLPRHGRRAVRGLRAGSMVLVAIVIGGALGAGALTSVAGRWTLPREWTVLACDVGQGDAVLLRSAGTIALIDTGPAPEPLAACLARAGISRIDLLVLTHYDLDHIGGRAAVVGMVGTVLHGPPDAEGRQVIAGLAAAGARTAQASAGMTGALGDARWRVLWPPPASRAFAGGNDASVVMEVRGGGIPSIVLLGDLSASPQRALEASGALAPPYAIVKVAHHGSADQDAALYAAIQPSVAVITVGLGNDYGHPRDETLAVLEDVGTEIWRTDRDGVVCLWSSEGAVSVWRDRGG